jgi:DNA-binding NarL/FixJ family response regulator
LRVEWQRELVAGADDDDPAKRLTPRERQVLALVRRGETSREIAAALHIAPTTVDSLVGSAMSKLSARTRTQAALLAAGEDRVQRERPALSPEEQMLLALAAEGVPVAEAARRLHISRRTAVRRFAHVRAVLDAGSNREAVIVAHATRESR